MRPILFVSAAVVVLSGCHAGNPYQAESLPLPPAPVAASTHFDRSAYPALRQDKNYDYWCWVQPQAASGVMATADQVEQRVLAEQLEQYGLRPAQSTEECQLQVQLRSQHGQRERRSYDDYPSAHYGVGYGRSRGYHDRYRHSGIGVDFPITPRSYTEHFQQLTLTFTDAQTQQLIWRTQSTAVADSSGRTSEEALRKTIDSMLQDYR